MDNLEALEQLRKDLQTLHASSTVSAEEKDQQARKLRRQIRALAEKLGQPRTARSSEPRHKKDGVRKSGSAIDLSQVQVFNRDGQEVGSEGSDGGKPRSEMTKAEKRKARRDARRQREGGATKERDVKGGVKARRGYLPPTAPDPSSDVAFKHVNEIKQRLTDYPLTVLGMKEKRTGYGIVLDTWPCLLPDGSVPKSLPADLLERQVTLIQNVVSKFEARMKKLPEWFFLLQQGPAVIVALGPLPVEVERLKSKPQYDEEDESD